MALREIHLHGKLAQKYGSTFKLDVTSPSQALRALSVQLDGFEEDLKEGAYRVVRGDLKTGLALKADELDIGLGRKELHIVPTPMAAGLEVIVIVGLTLVAAVGLSLALMPTIEAPDPNSREGSEQRNSGVFDGPVNVTEQGHPVPLVFGTMRVGSVVGAASIDTSDDRPNYVDNPGGGSGYGGSYGTGGFFGDLGSRFNQLAKGGKGGGSTRAAEEVPNSLQSNATAKIIDIVSEGEIGGLVDGLKSVYLDDTPVQNADDTFNFQGFALDERLGLPDQPFVMGFSSVEASSALGTEISVASGPVESTITTTTIDRIRVTLGVRAFYSQDTENGDIEETAATVAIDVKEDGGSFTEVGQMTFDGKTNDQYQRSFTFAAPKAGNEAPWTVRARRITPDSTSSALQNATYFDIITELTDVKMTYPDTAYFALTVDAKQFGSQIPTRSYHIKGLKILVPSNYDPETRVYTGVWDGTFKTAWTDNPAWVFYNLLINERWGLGKYINATNVDKFGLYAIAQYCDVMVDDGRGGTEPRFACNAVINTFRDALDLLTALASSFRSMIYWSAGSVMLSQDAPTTVSRIVTPSNVVDGEFNYSNGASYQDQFSAVLVSWNDPNESYRLNTEVVEDPELVETLGWRPVEITAFGCTSQAMAHRVGLWALEDQKTAGSMVQYIAGFDHADLEPGRVVATSDPRYTTQQLGGRVPSGATTTVVPLDRDVTLAGGETYTLMVMQTDGTVEERTVSTGAGTVSSLTVSSAFPEAAPAGAVWALKSTSVAPREWRIRGAQETDDGEFQMMGALHDSTKYTRVETGVSLEALTFTNLPTGPITPPVEVAILEYYKTEGNSVIPSLTVSVRPPLDDGRVTSFEIQHKRPNTDRWENLGQSSDIVRDVIGVAPGSHEFRARSLDNAGRFSAWVGRAVTVTAQTAALPEVSSLLINTRDAEMTTVLTWTAPTDVRPFKYEILFHSSSTNINDAAVVGFTEETQTPLSFPGNVWVRTAYMDQRSPAPVMTTVTAGHFPTVPRGSIDPSTITELETATADIAAAEADILTNAASAATNASNLAQELIDRAAGDAAEASARAAAIAAEAATRTSQLADAAEDRILSLLRPTDRERWELNPDDPDWATQVSHSFSGSGTPAETRQGLSGITRVTNDGAALEHTNNYALYGTQPLRDIAGRRYRWKARVRCTVDASGSEPNRILWLRRRYDKDFGYVSVNSSVRESDLTVADGWVDLEYEFDAIGDGTTAWATYGIQVNRGNGSVDAGSTTEIAYVTVEDITDFNTNAAAILVEQTARQDGDSANAALITALTATAAADRQRDIPPGVTWIGGQGDLIIYPNLSHDGVTSAPGEMGIPAGSLDHPSLGRQSWGNVTCNTPWESGYLPAEGRGYIFWSASAPMTRFGNPASGFGSTDEFFCAEYDYDTGQWYFVPNVHGDRGTFTPVDTDVLVGIIEPAGSGFTAITNLITSGAVLAADLATESSVRASADSAQAAATTALTAIVDQERYLNPNPTFELGKQGWSSQYTADGIGADFPTADNFGFSEVRTNFGGALQVTGYAYLASAWALKLGSGSLNRRFRYRAMVRTTVDSSNGNAAAFGFYLVFLDENGDYVTASSTPGATVLTVADDWTEVEFEFNASTYGAYQYARPMFIIGGANSGAQSNATMQLAYFYVEDIDDVYNEAQTRATAISALDTRVTATEAFAGRLDTLEADMGTAQTDIINNTTAIATETSARATQSALLSASFGQAIQTGIDIVGQPDPQLIYGKDFVGGGQYNNAGATPAVVAAEDPGSKWVPSTHEGQATLFVDDYEYFVTAWATKLKPGNTTRYAVRLKATADGTTGNASRVQIRTTVYDANWDYIDDPATNVVTDLTVADGWVTAYVDRADNDQIALGGSTGVYSRVMVLVNGSSSFSDDAEIHVAAVWMEDVTEVTTNAASAAQALSETATNATAISANASAITTLQATTATNAANITANATAITTEQGARATAISAVTASMERSGSSGKALNYNADMMDAPNGWTVAYGGSGHYDHENRGQTDDGMSIPVMSNSSSGRGLDFDSAGAMGANSAWFYNTRVVKIDVTRSYRVRVRYLVGTPGTANTSVYSAVVCLDSNYNFISGGAGTHRYGPGSIAASGYSNGDIIEFDWIISGTGDTSYEFRAGTDYVRVGGIANYNGGDSRVICLECSITDVTEEVANNAALSASIASETSARVAGDAAITTVTDTHQARFEGRAREANRTMTFDDPTEWSSSITTGDMDFYSQGAINVGTSDNFPALIISSKAYHGPRYAMRVHPGDEIEITIRAKVDNDGSASGGTFQCYAYNWNGAQTYVSTSTFFSQKKSVSDGLLELTGKITIASGVYWIRPYMYLNGNDGAGENATCVVWSWDIKRTTRIASAEADIITNASAIATESSARATETNVLRARLHSGSSASRFGFIDGFDDWQGTHNGDPTSVGSNTAGSQGWAVLDNSSQDSPWAYVTPDSNFRYIATRTVYPNILGRKYRVRIKVWYQGTTGSGQGALGLFGRKLDHNYSYAGSVLSSTVIEGTGTGGNLQFPTAPSTAWEDMELEITCDGTSKWFRPQLYVRGDWASPNGDVLLREMFVEEITPGLTSANEAITTAQADIVTNATAIATETAARAAQVNVLSATVGHVPGNVARNGAFEHWNDGEAYPVGWGLWSQNGGTPAKSSTVPAAQSHAIRMNISASESGVEARSGFQLTGSEYGIANDVEIVRKYVVTVQAYLASGSWEGAGIYFAWMNAGSTSDLYYDSASFTAMRQGDTLQSGKWLTFTTIVETSTLGSSDDLRIILMGNWTGFSGESMTAKNIIFGGVTITPLSENDQSPLARVIREESARATADSANASAISIVSAEMGAQNNGWKDTEIEGVRDVAWGDGLTHYGQFRYGTSGCDYDDIIANDTGPAGSIVSTERGDALQHDNYFYPFPACTIKAIAGRTYKFRFAYRCVTDGRNANVNNAVGYGLFYNSDFTSYTSGLSGSGVTFNSDLQVSDGWQYKELEFTGDAVIAAGYLWMRPWLLIGGTGGSANADNQILYMDIEDVSNRSAVQIVRNAIADASGNTANLTLDTSAGAGRSFIRMEATDKDGVVDSNIGIGARRIELYNTSGSGSWEKAMEVAAGDAVFYGSISAGAGIFFGDGETKWPVALQDKEYSVGDGDVISFGVTFDETPEFSFSGEGLDALATDEVYRLRAVSASGSGFTAELKILTPGTITAVTENTNATTPSGPNQMVAKAETADAYDDVYTFQIDGTMSVNHSDELGGEDFYFGVLIVETWFHDGTSWVQGPSKNFSYGELGINPTHTDNNVATYSFTNRTFQVTYTGTIRDSSTLGTFGASAASGGTVTELDQVTYNKQTTSGERTASPGGETCKVIVRPRNVTS